MLPAERHRRICEALRAQRIVSTEDFSRMLDVSAETVRRDLVTLERRGLLVRVHGGATNNAGGFGEEAPFDERSGMDRGAKVAIGVAAAALVRPGQTVVIDVGTTAVEVARALPPDYRGTVATCSLLVAAELAGRPNVEVLVSGGRLRAGDLVCSNAQTMAFFADLRSDVAFLGSGGVDASAGLTDFHLDEVATRRLILANTVRSYILADASKFGRVAPHRVCGLEEVDGLITDARPSPTLESGVERSGGIVVVA
ncbi:MULTISPECIES: DeoR/GlpR family DNA-binding transcription regulator [unclassified Streptomyces]|uniref:DeoR/GlpR family DNA-binding transcription regulator n=1 Tax=unclassified Streptomyces TaxID=2593676 RepID=UPI002E2DE160|nr:DeoR/GlpR family DNA-binding transcription regulator [Streptomyces sp. NBC_01429]